MKPTNVKPSSGNSGVESSSRSDELKNRRRKRSKKRGVEKPAAVTLAGEGAAAAAAAAAVVAPESASAKKKKEKKEQNAVKFLNADGPDSRLASMRRKSFKSAHKNVSMWQRLMPKRQKCPKDDFFKPGDHFDNGKFYIWEKIGQGGFGQVYKAQDVTRVDIPNDVALKVQIKTSESDRNAYELQVLAAFQGNPHCPKIYGSGSTARLSYFAMQLLGRSLSNIRRDCAFSPNRLSANAAYRSLVQCIRAVEGLHAIGQIHRDLKPSNFAVGYETSDVRRIFLLDYGLCRSYMNPDKSHKPKREDGQCGFRGTVRYASIASHDRNDVSRRDDCWQLFYQFVELLSGQLPWRMYNDKAEVGRMKRKFPPEAFCRVFPPEIGRFVASLRKLNFEEKPDYEFLASCFDNAADNQGHKHDEPFDWELEDCIWIKHWKPPYYQL